MEDRDVGEGLAGRVPRRGHGVRMKETRPSGRKREGGMGGRRRQNQGGRKAISFLEQG